MHALEFHKTGPSSPDGKVPSAYAGTGYKTIAIDVGSGTQSFVIPLGDDEEDVRKWREERRRRWPSRKNVEGKRKRDEVRRRGRSEGGGGE